MTVYCTELGWSNCCGATHVIGFDQNDNKDFSRPTLDSLVKRNKDITIYAITNDAQKWVEPELEKYGFQRILVAGNAHHVHMNRSTLTHWIRISEKSKVYDTCLPVKEGIPLEETPSAQIDPIAEAEQKKAAAIGGFNNAPQKVEAQPGAVQYYNLQGVHVGPQEYIVKLGG